MWFKHQGWMSITSKVNPTYGWIFLEAPHLDQDEDPPVALDDSALLGAPPMRSKLGLPSRTSIKRNCSEQFRAMVEQVVEAPCWFQETTGKRYGGDGLAKKTCKIHFSCCQSWVGNCRNFPIFVQAVWFAVSFNVICCNNHDVRCWKEANVPTQTGYQPMVTIGQSSRLVVHLSCLADIFFWSCLKHWAKPPKQKISY